MTLLPHGAGPLLSILLAVAGCLGGISTRADNPTPDLDPEATAEDLLDWILEVPGSDPEPPPQVWDVDLSLKGGFGYMKNVLYSAVYPLDSAFSMVEGDLFLVRAASAEQEFFIYTFADNRHYFELDRAQDEHMIFAEGNWTRRTSLAALNLKGYYTYLDQFFDSSISDADIQSSRLVQHEGGGSGYAERETFRRLYLRLGGAARDVDLQDYPDDYWAWEARARLEFRPRPLVTVGVSYRHVDEDYDERPQRTAIGEPIEDTTVHIVDERLGVYGRWRWGTGRRWGAEAQLTGILRTDDGGGYYDYQGWRGRLLLRGPLYGWRWEGGLYYGDTDYDVRPSRYGDVTSPRLYRQWQQFRLRFDRDLGSHWGCFAEGMYQDNRSNNPLDVYDHQWVALGIGYHM